MTFGGNGLLKKYQTVRYAIMAVKLPRKLPQVLFDSLKHQKRQFRLVFDQRQALRLEGSFEKHFTTYFPQQYQIDGLSFITPEVMEALVEADDYDFEIASDSLLMFGQLQDDPVAQITDMQQKILRVRDKLLHNILTYRDERLPYAEGRLNVARPGMGIANGPFWPLSLAFVGLRGLFRTTLVAVVIVLAILFLIAAALYLKQ